MRLFLTSFTHVSLVAINTILLLKGYVLAIFTVSYLISYLWTLNVSRISASNQRQKITYAFGAGCGAVFGFYLVNFIEKTLL